MAELMSAGTPTSSGVLDTKNGEGAGELKPGGRALPALRERKLFPLPFFACPGKKLGVSRCVKRRRERLCRIYDNCNEVVASLNWLAGWLS